MTRRFTKKGNQRDTTGLDSSSHDDLYSHVLEPLFEFLSYQRANEYCMHSGLMVRGREGVSRISFELVAFSFEHLCQVDVLGSYTFHDLFVDCSPLNLHMFHRCNSTVSYPVPAVVYFLFLESLRPAKTLSSFQ